MATSRAVAWSREMEASSPKSCLGCLKWWESCHISNVSSRQSSSTALSPCADQGAADGQFYTALGADKTG